MRNKKDVFLNELKTTLYTILENTNGLSFGEIKTLRKNIKHIFSFNLIKSYLAKITIKSRGKDVLLIYLNNELLVSIKIYYKLSYYAHNNYEIQDIDVISKNINIVDDTTFKDYVNSKIEEIRQQRESNYEMLEKDLLEYGVTPKQALEIKKIMDCVSLEDKIFIITQKR